MRPPFNYSILAKSLLIASSVVVSVNVNAGIFHIYNPHTLYNGSYDSLHYAKDTTIVNHVQIDNKATLYNWGVVRNLSGSTYTNSDYENNFFTNVEGSRFDNAGTLINDGRFTNHSEVNNNNYFTNTTLATFTNEGWGKLYNKSKFDNFGKLENSAIFHNTDKFNNKLGAQFTNTGNDFENNVSAESTNSGQWNNTGLISNWGKLKNQSSGELNNSGTIKNIGGYYSYGHGEITNRGKFNNNGFIDNSNIIDNQIGGVFTNSGSLNNGVITPGPDFDYPVDYSPPDQTNAYINNSGSWHNEASSELNNYGRITNSNSGHFTNAGTLTNGSGFFTGVVTVINGERLPDVDYGIHNYGSMTNQAIGIIQNQNVITNFAGATFSNQGTINNIVGSIKNYGNFYNKTGAEINSTFLTPEYYDPNPAVVLHNYAGASFINEGKIKAIVNDDYYAQLVIANDAGATFTNFGEIDATKLQGKGNYVQTAGSSEFYYATQASIEIAGGAFRVKEIYSDVTLSGTSTVLENGFNASLSAEKITGNVTVNGTSNHSAWLIPDDFGTTINGNYTQGELGWLDMSFNAKNISSLAVSGEANLAGTAYVSFYEGYGELKTGMSTFLTAATITGTFDKLEAASYFTTNPNYSKFDLSLVYDDNSVNLLTSSVVDSADLSGSNDDYIALTGTNKVSTDTYKNTVMLTNKAGSTLVNKGAVTNQGTVTNKGTIEGEGSYTQTAGLTRNNGSMTQGSVDIQGGKLQGNGVINSAVTVNGESASQLAYMAPGNSIDTLTINGDYTQGKFGVFEIEFDENSIDLLSVSGLVSLAGDAYFDFTGSIIQAGTFDFLTFGSITGNFDNVFLPTYSGYDFSVLMRDHVASLVIVESTVSSVPVPPALWLFGTTLIGLFAVRKKALAA